MEDWGEHAGFGFDIDCYVFACTGRVHERHTCDKPGRVIKGNQDVGGTGRGWGRPILIGAARHALSEDGIRDHTQRSLNLHPANRSSRIRPQRM